MNQFKELNEQIEEILPIYEMTKALSDQRLNVTIWVEDKSTHHNKYIKYYDASRKPTETAKRCARICIDKPEYFDDDNEHTDKIAHWYLSSKEKKEFIDLLKSPYKKNPNITNWQQIICTFNYGFYDIDEEDTIKGNISQEDLDDGALSIDFPMPDYSKL